MRPVNDQLLALKLKFEGWNWTVLSSVAVLVPSSYYFLHPDNIFSLHRRIVLWQVQWIAFGVIIVEMISNGPLLSRYYMHLQALHIMEAINDVYLGFKVWHWTIFTSLLIVGLVLYLIFDPNDPTQLYKSFKLNPANEDLRLLILEPGDWADPIICRLEKFGLASGEPYVALSYAWVEKYPSLQDGRQGLFLYWTRILVGYLEQQRWTRVLKYWRLVFGDTRKSQISVNGHKHEVGVNLELALRHIRQKRIRANEEQQANRDTDKSANRREVYLWADAICINQNDKKDRSRQVKSMHIVYQEATEIVIWLGAERDFRSLDCDDYKTVHRNRDEPTIAKDPRQGHDVVWTRVQNSVHDDTELETHRKRYIMDDRRLKDTQNNWDRFQNRPKQLRAKIEEDYTMEFFCMIYLLQGKAFESCHEFVPSASQPAWTAEAASARSESDNTPTKKKEKPSLDHRIPFLRPAANRAHILEVFAEVMDRLWWNRLWVVQETVIAKKVEVRYGRFVIPWDNLVLAAKNLKEHRHKPCCVEGFESLPTSDVDILMNFAETVIGLNTWRATWHEKGAAPIRLLRLLWSFRERQTTEFRDKIYALLPLVTRSPGVRGIVSPDYELSVPEVYKGVVRNLIRTEESLHVLAGNTMKSKSLEKSLPTWVPDWSQKPKPGELARLTRIVLYDTDQGRECNQEFHWRILGDNTYLELDGARFSTVKMTAAVMGAENGAKSDAMAKETFLDWEKLADLENRGRERYHNHSYDRDSAYFKTMAMDTVYRGEAWDTDNLSSNNSSFDRAPKDYGVAMRDWETYAAKGKGTRTKTYDTFFSADNFITTPLGSSSDDSHADTDHTTEQDRVSQASTPTMMSRDQDLVEPSRFLRLPGRRNTPEETFATMVDENSESATVSRRFFVTDSDHMGLGPEEIQTGDVVYVFDGSRVPFILRHAGLRHVDKGRKHPQITRSHTRQVGIMNRPRNHNDSTTGSQRQSVDCEDITMVGAVQTECFYLIGDCYVQGIMDGEFVSRSTDDGGSAVEFTRTYLV